MKLEAGEQRGEFESRDRVILRWSGILPAGDAGSLLAQLREACAEQKDLRIVCDLTHVQLLPSDARRALLGLGGLPIERIAVVAPDFALRVVMTMVLSVVEIDLGRANIHHFCATEAEAWAWLGEGEGGAQAATERGAQA